MSTFETFGIIGGGIFVYYLYNKSQTAPASDTDTGSGDDTLSEFLQNPLDYMDNLLEGASSVISAGSGSLSATGVNSGTGSSGAGVGTSTNSSSSGSGDGSTVDEGDPGDESGTDDSYDDAGGDSSDYGGD